MQQPSYWFPAKASGLGWGLPITWQGWVVVVSFFVLLAAGRYVLPPQQYQWPFSVYAAGLVLALVGVCVLKGEPLNR